MPSEKSTAGVKRFDGEPEEWTYGDPKIGHGVPSIVRKSGCTGPEELEKPAENMTVYKCHSVAFECEECGAVRRFATRDHTTMYHCKQCGTTRAFRFRWDLNR